MLPVSRLILPFRIADGTKCLLTDSIINTEPRSSFKVPPKGIEKLRVSFNAIAKKYCKPDGALSIWAVYPRVSLFRNGTASTPSNPPPVSRLSVIFIEILLIENGHPEAFPELRARMFVALKIPETPLSSIRRLCALTELLAFVLPSSPGR